MNKTLLAAVVGLGVLGFAANRSGLVNYSEALISKLDPAIREKARQVINLAAAQGIALIVTQGLRTNAEQDALFRQGRFGDTRPIVTNSPAGSSWHNFGLAFDVAVLKNGKATWPNDAALWKQIGAIGKSIGLSWGGDFTTITDLPHFEYHPGMTLADARAGKRPGTAMV